MTRFVPLPRSRRPAGPSLEAANLEEIIDITVRLRRRSQPAPIDAFAPMDRSAFAERHGARKRDITALTAYALRRGLTVVSRSIAARSVILRGSLRAVSAAFPADVRSVEIEGRRYRRRVGDVAVPRELAGIVEGIFGFTSVPHARPHAQGDVPPAASAANRGGQSMSPLDIARLYDFPEGVDGSGQCIGILQFGGGYREDDLDRYFQSIGVPRPEVVSVNVGHGRNAPSERDNGPDLEVALDIEIAGAVAPGARIAVYFAEWTERGFVDALSAAIFDTVHRPSVLCICWGFAELDASGRLAWTTAAIEAVNDTLEDAAALGITVLCASGDDGSSDGIEDARAHVDFPASSPWVLACGGTSMNVSQGSLVSESAWNEGARRLGGGATGGGVSEVIDLPDWQSDAGVPRSITTKKRGRGVPDVAGLAGGEHGYSIHLHGRDLHGVGGTSAVAPLYAGLFARINQALGRNVGYVTPMFYRGATDRGVFRDILTGHNDVTRLGGYTSSPGWDACTGWGSIRGKKLLDALAPPPPRVSHVEWLGPVDDSVDEIA